MLKRAKKIINIMQMLVSDISKAVEHWSSRIIVNSHNK